MSKIADPIKIFEALKKIIDLPDNVISLDLHLSLGETPTMKITKYIEVKNCDIDFSATEVKEYKIIPVE